MRIRRRHWVFLIIAGTLLMVLAMLLDVAAFKLFVGSGFGSAEAIEAAESKLEGRDWYRLARVMGYLPTWLLAALVLGLAGAFRRFSRPLAAAMALVLAPIVAGGGAEVLKRIIARERPTASGEYVHRAMFSGFSDSSNLGIPSSHVAVAFAAAAVIGMLYPKTRWVMLVLAGLCAMTRMAAGAHFLSDCVLGALLGMAAAMAVTPPPSGERLSRLGTR